jgi:hypothetical protein
VTLALCVFAKPSAANNIRGSDPGLNAQHDKGVSGRFLVGRVSYQNGRIKEFSRLAQSS